MAIQNGSLARWAAALALTMAAVLAADDVVPGTAGVVVLPLAVYAAAAVTGWAQKDAMAIAAGSSLPGVIVGWVTVGRLTSVSLVAFGLVTLVALRPQGRRILGYRLLALIGFFLVALQSGAWWTVLLVPAVVAATDEVVALTASGVPELAGSGEIASARSAEETVQARRGVSAALTVASLACLFLVAEVLYLPTSGPSGVPPLLVGFATAVGGVVLSLRALRSDPMRAAAALVLSAIPLVVLGFFALIVLGGGIEIGN